VAQLNKQIRVARAGGRAEPNDLLDVRQTAQDRLAELVGAKSVSDEQGNVSLHLQTGGAFVAGDEASRFALTPDAGDYDHPTLQVAGTSGTKMNVRPGSISGALGGLLSARDETVLGAARSLDQLAYDFAGSVNLVHRSGTDLLGQNGADLFLVPTSAPGAARAFTLDTHVESNSSLLATKSSGMAGSGDSSITQQLLGLENAKLAGGSNPTTSYASIVARFGVESRTAKDAADHTKAMRINIEAMRDSVTGVSVDEELVDMSKAQRAYEAISKVMTTADSMLDTLLKLR
jgi:flagellar hook-associated protein 1 FlgK